MINNVVLVGRLTKDVDLRYTGSGTAVGNFTIAADRPFTNNQGERETDFINCVIWRKSAETLANFTRKGSLIGITGRIQTRNYENNQGQRVYVTEVVADNFQLLEPKSVTDQRKQNADSNSGQNQSYPHQYQDQSSSTTNQQAPNYDSFSGFNDDPFDQSSDQVEISDDDLPF